MNSDLSLNLGTRYSDSNGDELLSVALIGPDQERRGALSKALIEGGRAKVNEFHSYPSQLDDVPRLLEQCFDVVVLDLDSDPEIALKLIDRISANDAATVIVYSELADQNLLLRCLRAGAREFLVLPLEQGAVAEALVRVETFVRARTRPAAKKTLGRLLTFLGAKGGSGVTTVACNLAIALAQESDQSILLIDLALPIGDAALNLGIAAEHSTDHALRDIDRLDGSFLQKLLVKHRSGVFVLAAPSRVPEVEASKEAIDKLMTIARREFDYVIVDVGSRIDLMGTALFKEASTVYMVTQAGVSELRNANRVISQFFSAGIPKLEVVINRFEPSFLGAVNEEVVAKALGRPVRWKIPDDQDAARKLQHSDTGLFLAETRISRLSLEMASSITGRPVPQEKKKGFVLRGFGRSVTEKISNSDEPSNITIAPSFNEGTTPTVEWSTPDPITYGDLLGADQLNATASVPGILVYTPGPGYVLPVGTYTLWVTFTRADSGFDAPVLAAVSITVSKATPDITWRQPFEMSYGSALSATQLNALASVPGTFDYSPAAGEVLPAGTHSLLVTFFPANGSTYSTAQATVPVTVVKATPAIAWSTPEPTTCGTALDVTQLNATASVPGRFDYSPTLGEALPAGTHTLLVTFTPTDNTNYTTAQATLALVVGKATPVIAWSTPDPMTYGTLLGIAQLNATASVAGTFAYDPGPGATLAAGEHTPSVIFTPTDGSSHSMTQAVVSLTVAKATPAIAWPTPDPIVSGSPLSAIQLNATASVPGSFDYTPAVGDIPEPGTHTLSVTFTPTDTLNYTTAKNTVSLTVTEIAPTDVAWLAPSAISYGTPLSVTQLNATASVPGTFVYTPAAGHVLAPGRYTLSVSFIPEDTKKYAPAQATVSLEVEGRPAETPYPQAVTANDTADQVRDEITSERSPNQNGPGETRMFKGAVYEKGEDGQWHLRQN